METNALTLNATFMLSTMLGLQLQLPEGYGINNGNVTTIETTIPLSTAAPKIRIESPQNITRMSKNLNKCGSVTCKSDEICVSWQKEGDSRRGANLVKECMLNDGQYTIKTNPDPKKLCGQGEIHSLIITEPRKCLKDAPACEIVWKYKCVPEKDSPHSCTTRKCPPNFICAELLHCERHPPCIIQTECHHISQILTHK